MKILLTTDTVGGVWTYVIDLAGELAKRGHEVVLAAFGGLASPEQQAQIAGLPGGRLYSSAWKLEWMDDPWDEVAASGAWLQDLAGQVRPDLVHLNTLAHGALPWEVPTLLVAHSCVLSWWQAVKGEPAPPAWETYRARVTASSRGADAVVAPSAALLAQIDALYGPLAQSAVIYNGREPLEFPSAAKEEFILATGRLWDEAKNISALARIAHRLPWPVYAAGDALSPDGRSLDPGSLRLLGKLPPRDLAAWLGRAAIFVAPAKYEPFGLGILEAALAGCALVLGDIASLREIWGDDAIFVPPGDDDALCSAILDLTRDSQARTALAGRSRETALIYSTHQMTDRYLDLYHRLLKQTL